MTKVYVIVQTTDCGEHTTIRSIHKSEQIAEDIVAELRLDKSLYYADFTVEEYDLEP